MRRHRALLVAAAIGVMAIVAWLVLRPRASEESDATDETAERGHEGAGGARGAGDEDDAESAAPEPRVAPLRLGTARVVVDEGATTGLVRGVVVSLGSEVPVEGATLTFTHGGRTLDVTSERDGSWELRPPEPGRYELSFASAPGHLPYAPEWGHSPVAFYARAGQRIEDVRVLMVPAIEYAGLVRTADDQPVPDAEVVLLGAASGEQRLAPIADRFRTGADGTFTFHAPDDAVLEAHHSQHGTGRAKVGFETQVSKRLVITLDRDVTERASGAISGRVVDHGGEPIADAVVRGVFEVENRAATGADLHPPAETTTEPDGRFTLRGLDRGTYTLIASAREHASARERGIETGATGVTLTLAPEAVLEGLVVDAAGAAVPAFAVVVQESAGALERRTAAVQSVFDPDGRFRVPGLARGSYLVRVVAQGYATSDEASVTVPTATPARFVLSRGGRIEGTVTSADGTPIEGARVTLEGGVGEGPSAVPLASTTLSDARGRYALEGVGSGLSSILAAASGHHGRVISGLRVASEETLRVDVDLTPTEEGETPRIELAGIGAVLSTEGDVLVIGRVVEGGGAAEAGLTTGDAILAIEGTPVGELGFQGSIERIRGPEGTSVRLTVRRESGTETIAVPRRRIRA